MVAPACAIGVELPGAYAQGPGAFFALPWLPFYLAICFAFHWLLGTTALVGAIILVGEHKSTLAATLGFIAVVAATSNIVGGFLITDRMLRMFKSSRPAAKP